MQWFRVLSLAQIPTDNIIKTLLINGKRICIIKCDGKLYATQQYCPHAGGNFAGGWCKDGQLVCPIHRYEYNLETGKGAEGQGDYIDIFPTELRQDGLYVGFKESWWSKLWS